MYHRYVDAAILAGFLDIPGELSDNTTKLRFMLPSADQFAATQAGVTLPGDRKCSTAMKNPKVCEF
jgi:hypothetical protein